MLNIRWICYLIVLSNCLIGASIQIGDKQLLIPNPEDFTEVGREQPIIDWYYNFHEKTFPKTKLKSFFVRSYTIEENSLLDIWMDKYCEVHTPILNMKMSHEKFIEIKKYLNDKIGENFQKSLLEYNKNLIFNKNGTIEINNTGGFRNMGINRFHSVNFQR